MYRTMALMKNVRASHKAVLCGLVCEIVAMALCIVGISLPHWVNVEPEDKSPDKAFYNYGILEMCVSDLNRTRECVYLSPRTLDEITWTICKRLIIMQH